MRFEIWDITKGVLYISTGSLGLPVVVAKFLDLAISHSLLLVGNRVS